MKKLIIACLLLISTAAVAQTGNEGRKWTVTPRVGMTISDYTNDKKDMYSARTAFSAGVEAEYRISPLIGVSGGVFYSSQGAKVNYYYTEAMDMKAQEYNFFSN
ncbi:MAG: outer membrane beta-barrel protein, partial [Prevotella sp.]|nr:outer membrane beta-barrel protein [Prevotella sp.]